MKLEERKNRLINQLNTCISEKEAYLTELRDYIYKYQENDMDYICNIDDIISKIYHLNTQIDTYNNFLKPSFHQI